jgi:nucleoid DNA-binding protein
MHELITKIAEEAGISNQQAATALETVKTYVKEKFPMMAGAVDNLFGATEETPPSPSNEVPPAAAPTAEVHPIIDKISEVLHSETSIKMEAFAINAVQKAEEAIDMAKNKLNDLLKGDKK